MSPENLTLIQFLIGLFVFRVILFFLYGLVHLIDKLQRKIKQENDRVVAMMQIVTDA